MSKMLNAAALSRLLSSRKVERVELPVAGLHAYVRLLSVRERLDIMKAVKEVEWLGVALLAASLCDESGASLNLKPEALLESLSQADFDTLATAATRINGLDGGAPAPASETGVGQTGVGQTGVAETEDGATGGGETEDGEAANPSPVRKRVRRGSSSGSRSRSGGRSKSSTKA